MFLHICIVQFPSSFKQSVDKEHLPNVFAYCPVPLVPSPNIGNCVIVTWMPINSIMFGCLISLWNMHSCANFANVSSYNDDISRSFYVLRNSILTSAVILLRVLSFLFPWRMYFCSETQADLNYEVFNV